MCGVCFQPGVVAACLALQLQLQVRLLGVMIIHFASYFAEALSS
jgi:hypothetical protein